MPPGFRYPAFADLWVPVPPRLTQPDRNDRSIGVVARLGVTLAEARAELRGLGDQLALAFPEVQAEWTSELTPLHEDFSRETGQPFLLMMGAVGFVLLIACANLAALFLARMTSRRREMAVRAALGATRGQLIRIVVIESLLVALVGGTLGVLIALWGVSVAGRGFSEPVPYWVRFELDWRVLVFALSASVASGLVFGLLPALRASRPDVLGDLKDGTPGGGSTRNRLGQSLVVIELALALVLLSGAVLQIRTFLRVTHPPSRFDAEQVLQADLPLVGDRFADPERVALAAAAILERLERIPRSDAALSATEFLAGFGAEDQPIAVQGTAALAAGASPRFAFYVTPAYLGVYGRSLVEGRGISPADHRGSQGVVVVNQAMARRIWPGQSPLGRQLKLGADDASHPWLTVVGVVADPPASPTGGGIPSEAWGALSQSPMTGSTLQLSLRTDGDPTLLVRLIRNEVREADDGVPVERVQTAAAGLGQQFWQVRFFATLFGVFAAIALLLAAIGTYGLLAHLVGQRTREIGVRLALGADAARVTRMILGQAAALGVVGSLLGLAGSFGLSRLMLSLLYGTSPLDPVVAIAVTLFLGGITLLAGLVPARRAARVQPVEALRSD
jgi:predicted permease